MPSERNDRSGLLCSDSIYLLATFWLWPGPNGVSAPPFLSKHLLDYFRPDSEGRVLLTTDPGPSGEAVTETPPLFAIPNSQNVFISAPFPGRVVNFLHYRRFRHSLAAILFGIVGALVGRFFASEERSGGAQSVPSSRGGLVDLAAPPQSS